MNIVVPLLVLALVTSLADCERSNPSTTGLPVPDNNNFLIDVSDALLRLNLEFSELSKPEQVFISICWIEGEVNNGGFHQFYWNSAGDHALETVDAFEAIGASQTADILLKANAVFASPGPSRNRDDRQKQLDALPDSGLESFNAMDEQFYEYKDNLTDLLTSYVRANAKAFRTL